MISARGRQRTVVLVQRDEDDATRTYWADATAPNEERAIYADWLRKAIGLYVTDFLPVSTSANAPSDLRIDYYRGEELLGTLELLEECDEEESERATYRAHTEHTLRWVRVSAIGAAEVLQDVENVLSE